MSDGSSDVCSSDLDHGETAVEESGGDPAAHRTSADNADSADGERLEIGGKTGDFLRRPLGHEDMAKRGGLLARQQGLEFGAFHGETRFPGACDRSFDAADDRLRRIKAVDRKSTRLNS